MSGPALRRRRLVVMARWPAPGRCKRRLASSGLGHQRASQIQARMGHHCLLAARQACDQLGASLVLATSGLGPRASRRWAQDLGCNGVLPQGSGGLGVRLQRQLQAGFRDGAEQVVVVGSDLPELEPADLLEAFATLEQQPLVLGPAADGGYWLIGLSQPCAALCCGVPWGSAQVLACTEAIASAQGLAWRRLRQQGDLDRTADLARWR